ncbi:MAG: zinc ribbon domain-containing protein [Spirochaetia bacterium]|nr:zinc ribbon domain-containing protein [Spirochaetia bacterium]
MAIYTFECQDCSKQFDERMTYADKEAGKQIECPSCNSQKTLQVFRPLAVLGSKTGSSWSPEASGGACMPGGCGCFPESN